MSLLKPILVCFSMMFYIATSAQVPQDVPATSFTQKDTSYWIYNFRQFRDAVYQNDIAKAKAFVDFPFVGETNDIWYLLNAKVFEKMGDKIKPLTEAEFARYFNSLFPKNFVKCLLKVKTDELYRKGSYDTPFVEDSLASESSMMYTTLDKSDNTLELNLSSRTASNEDGDTAEFSIIYHFQITRKGHIKLKSVGLAG